MFFKNRLYEKNILNFLENKSEHKSNYQKFYETKNNKLILDYLNKKFAIDKLNLEKPFYYTNDFKYLCMTENLFVINIIKNILGRNRKFMKGDSETIYYSVLYSTPKLIDCLANTKFHVRNNGRLSYLKIPQYIRTYLGIDNSYKEDYVPPTTWD